MMNENSTLSFLLTSVTFVFSWLYWWMCISDEYEVVSLNGDVASNQMGSSDSISHFLGRTLIIFGIFIGFFHTPLIELAIVFDEPSGKPGRVNFMILTLITECKGESYRA